MSFKYVKEGDKRPIASVVVCGRIPSIHEEPVLPPVEEPQEPSEPIETPSVSPETGESEETPMEDNKPSESPEIVPVEGWTDPEPTKEDHVILNRIAALLSVKSIITIFLTVIFGLLVLRGEELPDKFVSIYTMCISFFFGYQFKKAEGGGDK